MAAIRGDLADRLGVEADVLDLLGRVGQRFRHPAGATGESSTTRALVGASVSSSRLQPLAELLLAGRAVERLDVAVADEEDGRLQGEGVVLRVP